MANWLITGGAGFIGKHLIRHILDTDSDAFITSVDIRFPSVNEVPDWYRAFLSSGRLKCVELDIRKSDDWNKLPTNINAAIHLAAICREPGHKQEEYFETNVSGTENLVSWLNKTACRKVAFTSSIAIYGNTRNGADEKALPMPETPYGISKLLAEKILERWQAQESGRTLITIRPGVVFGEGEAANVTRLIRALTRNRFVYFGNQSVPKASGYVKDLCDCASWLMNRQDCEGKITIANFCFPQCPRLADYVAAAGEVVGRKFRVPNIPFHLVLSASYLLQPLVKLLGRSSDIHPRRIEKLVWPTFAIPRYLIDSGYEFRHDLESAFADWNAQAPSEWQ